MNQRSNCQHLLDHRKNRIPEKHLTSASLIYMKAFDCGQILKEKGMSDHHTCPLRTCMQVKKQQLELDMEQWTVSKLRKEYIKAVYCHPAYLTSVQSASSETRLDGSQTGIKIAGRNINNLRYADDTTLMAESEEELKSLLMRLKEESKKAGLKFKIKKKTTKLSHVQFFVAL